ncbi:MAG: hypothetical protein U1G07_12960 [Verrucomicrobiota bacterium]
MERARETKQRCPRNVVDVVEYERIRVAKQLHEGLLQTLSAASILVRVLALKAKGRLVLPQPEFGRLEEIIDSASDEARLLIKGLQLAAGEPQSLIEGLTELAKLPGSKCICAFSCQAPTTRTYSRKISSALVRIAHEAVYHALSRPGVSRIEIDLVAKGNVLTLAVTDNAVRTGTADAPAGAQNYLMAYQAARIRADLKTRRSKDGMIVTCTCKARRN